MKKLGLAFQIILGLILGIIIGAIFYGNPVVTSYLQPFGDIFIRLIKMIVIPRQIDGPLRRHTKLCTNV